MPTARPFVFVATLLLLATCAPYRSDARRGASPQAGPAQPHEPPIEAAPAPPPAPQFPADWSYPQGAAFPHSSLGMVVTDAAEATKVGASILASGGNAVDAAVAAAFALAVTFPMAGNIGGGGFLVAQVDHRPYALDFRETAPLAATRDMYLGADRKPTHESRDGWRSSGVPGSIAGLWEAWHSLGSKNKSWQELLTPAIDLAEHGIQVDAPFAGAVALLQQRLAKYPESAALFLPNGAPPPIGSTWRDPDLAAVLRRVAEKGPAGFYEGPVADAIARAMKEHQGLITAADLHGYHAKWRDVVAYEYRGHKVVSMPPPSSGGLTNAMIAHILSHWDLRQLGWHSPEHVHLAAEAMRRAFAARNAKLGDPDFVANPVAELLSDAWAAQQRSTILPGKATPTRELFPNLPPGSPDGPHTTHMSVVDNHGNAVAMTTTINLWFGSGATVPGLGFVLNDEMDDFATVPGTANAFGLVQGEPNGVAPGKRMLSSMAPTIVLDSHGSVELVLGAAGGSRIITTVFQELSNVLDFDFNPADAVRAPRFHQQDVPDLILLEPRGLPDDVRQTLEGMGHATKIVEHIADAPAIGLSAGLWGGAAEPRRNGSLALGL